MKTVIETYVGIWIILIFVVLSSSFLNIHLNIMQARRIADEIKINVQASNGSFIPDENDTVDNIHTFKDYYLYDSAEPTKYNPSNTEVSQISIANGDNYEYQYRIDRVSLTSSQSEGETYIYNDIYKITLIYKYLVPIFGEQVYPITIYAY